MFMMATILDVRDLTVELPTTSGWIRPVNDVSFTLNEGETLGIVGESGSGKTMLSLALMGLNRTARGIPARRGSPPRPATKIFWRRRRTNCGRSAGATSP